MDDILIQNAQVYASRRQLRLTSRLGFGVHGIIFAAEGNPKAGKRAIKVHRSFEPYRREVDVYLRLKQVGVVNILGFNVPQLLGHDDGLSIIDMTVVERPFVLDFAGAYLDIPPEFPDTVWAEWEAEKQEQFGARWPEVQAVLAALEEMDIHMVDVSPSNVAVAED